MKNLDWKTGLLRLYYALWGVGASVGLIAAIVGYYYDQRPEYFAVWLGLTVIAPAVLLKLVTWIGKGFITKT